MNAYIVDFTYTQKSSNDTALCRMCIIADSYSQAIAKGVIELDGIIKPSTPVNTMPIVKYKDVVI